MTWVMSGCPLGLLGPREAQERSPRRCGVEPHRRGLGDGRDSRGATRGSSCSAGTSRSPGATGASGRLGSTPTTTAGTTATDARPVAAESRPEPAAAAPAPVAVSSASGPQVQLGAFDSDSIAASEWNRLSGKHVVFGGKQQVIQQHQSNGRTFWRLRVAGFGSLSEARQFCAALKSAGTDCLALN